MASGRNYEKDLLTIDHDVTALFSLVQRAVASAVDAMTQGNRAVARVVARRVVERDALIDSLYGEIEDLACLQFVLQAPAALDMAYLLTVLRIVPELERSGDLAEHVGKQAARGTFDGLAPEIQQILERAGQLVVAMWTALDAAYLGRDTLVGDALKPTQQLVDELHEHLIAELVASKTATPMAIEIALTARYLNRLAAHAALVGRRVQLLRPDVPRRSSVQYRSV
jgi:phosphate transport system protein